jgi:hypothetical protein
MNPTIPAPKKDETERANEDRNLAYLQVFGSEGNRTAAQKLVMSDMRARGFVSRPVFIPDATGALCPVRAALSEGRRLSVLEIESFIRAASVVDEKQKPKVKKERTQ